MAELQLMASKESQVRDTIELMAWLDPPGTMLRRTMFFSSFSPKPSVAPKSFPGSPPERYP